MDNIKEQLNKYLSGDELIKALTILPPYREGITDIPDRLTALLDIYKIFIPSRSAPDIYNRLYLALLNSLEKKNTLLEVGLQNDNFRAVKGLKRYGIIGGLESFRITGTAGLGKTSSVQRCSEIITDKILKSSNPYREIIPVLFIECVADGSFKSLLYSILQEVDRLLNTSYFVSNRHVTTTVDALLAAVSNVLINHVAVLVIDEIERVANDSRKGITLINYLTQLVNQSNIAICFVGNESANRYFETKEYMSRRTIGISISKMEYDDYYFNFVRILFNYQYTLKKVEFNAELARLLYKLSNGIPSMLVCLFAETQRNAILSGKEELTPAAFEATFKDNFSTMAPYIELDKFKVSVKKEVTEVRETETVPIDKQYLLYRIRERVGKDFNRFISLLKDNINVEYIKL
ncbi:MAG: AAA family ATPase [Clostridia bacterium]|nr:AAA family ATPase [Clostridia bacterium]